MPGSVRKTTTSTPTEEAEQYHQQDDDGAEITAEPFLKEYSLLRTCVQMFASVGPFFWLILSIGLNIISLYFSLTRPIFITYCLWLLLMDKAPWTGKRKMLHKWRVDKWGLAHYLQEYIPFKLVKTVDLDPETDGPFIFGLHPHAVLGYSFWSNFASECTGFSDLFPLVDIRLCTLNLNFKIPFAREFLMMRGFISADKKAIANVLRSDKKMAVGVVVGGAAEAQYAHPGMNSIVLKKRKGFIKLAIQNGASLVPVYTFGENNIFKQIKLPLLQKFQKFVMKHCSFYPVLFVGWFGTIIPLRKQVVTVVGAPIRVERRSNPSQSEIDAFHARYIKELKELFDKYKDIYDKDRKQDLKIVA